MRSLEIVGCEYGTDWGIEEILKEHLEPVDKENVFEEMIEDCYPTDTKAAWVEINNIDVLKEMCLCDDYIYNREQNEEVMSFDNGSTYFWTSDIENLIEKKLKKEASFISLYSFWGTNQTGVSFFLRIILFTLVFKFFPIKYKRKNFFLFIFYFFILKKIGKVKSYHFLTP